MLQHEGSNHCLDVRNVEQMEDERQLQSRNDWEMRFLGINSLFIGTGSLGTQMTGRPKMHHLRRDAAWQQLQ